MGRGDESSGDTTTPVSKRNFPVYKKDSGPELGPDFETRVSISTSGGKRRRETFNGNRLRPLSFTYWFNTPDPLPLLGSVVEFFRAVQMNSPSSLFPPISL